MQIRADDRERFPFAIVSHTGEVWRRYRTLRAARRDLAKLIRFIDRQQLRRRGK
jgi:hypothetical protein